MKTKLLITSIVLLLGIAFFSSAQNVITDQKGMGSPGISLGKAILVHDSTGYLIVGVIDTTGGHTRIWLINMVISL